MPRKIFTVVVAGFFLYVASPMLVPVSMGALFAVLLLPLQEKLERWRFSTVLAALTLTIGTTLLLIVPLSISLYLGAKAVVGQLQALKGSPALRGDWIAALMGTPGVRIFVSKINEFYPIGTGELVVVLEDFIRTASGRIAEFLGGVVTHLPGMVMSIVVVVLSIYFLLVDGRSLVLFFRRNSFFSAQHTDRLILTLESTCRSVLLASLASGAAQGLFEFVVTLLLGHPAALLIGAGVFLGSFVPVIGSAPVTLGVAAQMFFSGNSAAGVVLLISAAIVATLDNVIRPLFLRGSVNLHPLLAFVAAFGGLQTLGFAGVFVGPIVAALLVVTIQILFQDNVPNSGR